MSAVKTNVRTASALLAAVLTAAVAVGGAGAKMSAADHRFMCEGLQARFQTDMNHYDEAVAIGVTSTRQKSPRGATGELKTARLRGCSWAS